ncbi:hypothetical protein CPB83DRAFT_860220 [Crepidotus variabilis]|uniref:Uncharacterized protein n=1 Tax=Crepidotus variabilis TaxID=179855 RepID=A0A9P6E9K8_9AGAR|nr:hypothetical protein CPB83DRAFT_860220 [Crepidotus variabilis]
MVSLISSSRINPTSTRAAIPDSISTTPVAKSPFILGSLGATLFVMVAAFILGYRKFKRTQQSDWIAIDLQRAAYNDRVWEDLGNHPTEKFHWDRAPKLWHIYTKMPTHTSKSGEDLEGNLMPYTGTDNLTLSVAQPLSARTLPLGDDQARNLSIYPQEYETTDNEKNSQCSLDHYPQFTTIADNALLRGWPLQVEALIAMPHPGHSGDFRRGLALKDNKRWRDPIFSHPIEIGVLQQQRLSLWKEVIGVDDDQCGLRNASGQLVSQGLCSKMEKNSLPSTPD